MTAQLNSSKRTLSHNPIRHSVELEGENIFVVEKNMCSLINDCLNSAGLLLLARNISPVQGRIVKALCVPGHLIQNAGHDTVAI